MLEPRKLMPFSIEYCDAPIAVITEITENTPMVVPSIVSTERSLFAPRDDHAIFMISPKSILLGHHSDLLEHGFTKKVLQNDQEVFYVLYVYVSVNGYCATIQL